MSRTNGTTIKEVALFYPDEVIRGPRLGRGSFGDVYEVQRFQPLHGDRLSSSRLEARRHYFSAAQRRVVVVGGKENLSNSKYAIKCLRDDFEKPAMYRLAAKDMEKEVAILTKIDHPFIIKVYAKSASGTRASACTKEDSRNFFIVMDRLSCTLTEKIDIWRREKQQQQRTGMTPLFYRGAGAHKVRKKALLNERLSVAADISSALAYLHEQRIIYRDLKADNVGFDVEGKCKIFDFGLARRLPSDPDKKTRNDAYIMSGKTGSLILMAPEVFNGEPYNEKADVYSMAVLLWNMLALDLPYVNFIKQGAFEEKVMGKGLRPDMKGTWPKQAQLLLHKAWQMDYNARPTMKEVHRILKETTTSPGAPSASTTRRARESPFRSSFM